MSNHMPRDLSWPTLVLFLTLVRRPPRRFAVVASALVVFNSAIDVNLPFSGVCRLESGTVAASL